MCKTSRQTKLQEYVFNGYSLYYFISLSINRLVITDVPEIVSADHKIYHLHALMNIVLGSRELTMALLCRAIVVLISCYNYFVKIIRSRETHSQLISDNSIQQFRAQVLNRLASNLVNPVRGKGPL